MKKIFTLLLAMITLISANAMEKVSRNLPQEDPIAMDTIDVVMTDVHINLNIPDPGANAYQITATSAQLVNINIIPKADQIVGTISEIWTPYTYFSPEGVEVIYAVSGNGIVTNGTDEGVYDMEFYILGEDSHCYHFTGSNIAYEPVIDTIILNNIPGIMLGDSCESEGWWQVATPEGGVDGWIVYIGAWSHQLEGMYTIGQNLSNFMTSVSDLNNFITYEPVEGTAKVDVKNNMMYIVADLLTHDVDNPDNNMKLFKITMEISLQKATAMLLVCDQDSPITITETEYLTFSIEVWDEKRPLPNAPIEFYVNDEHVGDFVTDSETAMYEGVFQAQSFEVPTGVYTIQAKYLGNEEYLPCESEVLTLIIEAETALDNATMDAKTQKTLRDGRLVIRVGEREFDAQGAAL